MSSIQSITHFIRITQTRAREQRSNEKMDYQLPNPNMSIVVGGNDTNTNGDQPTVQQQLQQFNAWQCDSLDLAVRQQSM